MQGNVHVNVYKMLILTLSGAAKSKKFWVVCPTKSDTPSLAFVIQQPLLYSSVQVIIQIFWCSTKFLFVDQHTALHW